MTEEVILNIIETLFMAGLILVTWVAVGLCFLTPLSIPWLLWVTFFSKKRD